MGSVRELGRSSVLHGRHGGEWASASSKRPGPAAVASLAARERSDDAPVVQPWRRNTKLGRDGAEEVLASG